MRFWCFRVLVAEFFATKTQRHKVAQRKIKEMEMRKIIFVFAALLILISCTKKEAKFEAFTSDAFAYDLGNGNSEVNANVRVKGFTQTEKNGRYDVLVSFNIDLVKPDSSVIKSIFSDTKKESAAEPIHDLELDAQFNLDSSFTNGNYKLIFNVTDDVSKNNLTKEVSFDITK